MPRTREAKDLLASDDDFVKALQRKIRENANDADALAALGIWLLSREQPDHALECFHRVTRADPTYPGIWRLKARAFDALGDHESAEQCRKRGSDPHS